MVAAAMERRLWIQVYWDDRCSSTWKKARKRTPFFWLERSNKRLEQAELRKGHRSCKPLEPFKPSITKCVLNQGQSSMFVSNLTALFLSLKTISPHKLTPSRYDTFLTFSYLDLDTLMHNVKFKSPSCPHHLCNVGSCAPCPTAPKCFLRQRRCSNHVRRSKIQREMLGPLGSKQPPKTPVYYAVISINVPRAIRITCSRNRIKL